MGGYRDGMGGAISQRQCDVAECNKKQGAFFGREIEREREFLVSTMLLFQRSVPFQPPGGFVL